MSFIVRLMRRIGLAISVYLSFSASVVSPGTQGLQTANAPNLSEPAGEPVSPGIGGVLSKDTIWRVEDSPITVSSDLVVPVGMTLSIEAGAEVRLGRSVLLIIEGRLLAEGTSSGRILFTRAATMGGHERWGGVLIYGSIGSPESLLRHVHLEFNHNKAIRVRGGAVLLDHVTFGTTDRAYLDLENASFLVRDCVFPSATAKFEMVDGDQGIRSDGHGIFLRNFFGTPIGYSDVIDFTGGNRPGPILQVLDNVFTGGTDDGLDLDGTDAWIEGNIFQRVHRNGDTPDSAAAISSGNYGTNTSEITIFRNIFFDCDNAATAKQGNFFTMINNTIVRTTKSGGIDFDSGVLCVRDTHPWLTTAGRGFYLEGNIIVEAEQLVRNYDPALSAITFNHNILPMAWSGPGTGNLVMDPLLKHIPDLSETGFTNWAQAQVYWDWFSLRTESPAHGTGPHGRDQGAVIPGGLTIYGEPEGEVTQNDFTIFLGFNRAGFGIPLIDWPHGSGFTHYKWRLAGSDWSAETPITTPIQLSGLPKGAHAIEVIGKNDGGYYQNDPRFGRETLVSRSRTWTVTQEPPLRILSVAKNGSRIEMIFRAEAGRSYAVEYCHGLDGAQVWSTHSKYPAQATGGERVISDDIGGNTVRIYRIRWIEALKGDSMP